MPLILGFGNTRPGLDSERFNQLVDELEVEDYLKKAVPDDRKWKNPLT